MNLLKDIGFHPNNVMTKQRLAGLCYELTVSGATGSAGSDHTG